MHSTMIKRIEDLNSSIDIRKRAGADMKLKSIHLCLKQMRDDRMGTLNGYFD